MWVGSGGSREKSSRIVKGGYCGPILPRSNGIDVLKRNQPMASSQRPSPQQVSEVLAGIVERVTFHNEENGFCVLRVKARGHRDLVTVVGHAATPIRSASRTGTISTPPIRRWCRSRRRSGSSSNATTARAMRGGSGCLDSSPRILSGFLPGFT